MRNVNAPEGRKIATFHTLLDDIDILERFSSFPRALRVVAYMFRFIEQLKSKVKGSHNFPCNTVTHPELQKAKVAYTQARYFSRDISLLRESKPIDKKSSLLVLNPFLDTKGLLLANGWLANSSLTYNERHPIIIPERSPFATLFLHYIHILVLHAEHRLMQHVVRQEYYIPRLKPQIRKCIFTCKICTMHKQKMRTQIMAALPLERCNLALPLTKAVHLEQCSKLTTEAFLAAFARFVARRGYPSKIIIMNQKLLLELNEPQKSNLWIFKTSGTRYRTKVRPSRYQLAIYTPKRSSYGRFVGIRCKKLQIPFQTGSWKL
ncbi:uncharacterized protein LOC125776323 isoform X2 [Bactrocera dorsalis]|uniref:Uncharacterized protein LOC125776323 isoform X2 n=1 Tax=Bactrocera dorsalis TaxID=27457 RepID=A0ABM3J459_BACDO|nr:uncharacterized protein LOC125776323 isoform X2 [Bactrocera dorsalis]